MKQATTFQDDLVILLKARDPQAFSRLYYQYSNALLGIITRIVDNDQEMAKDVLQEAMMKIWNNIGQFDATKGSLFTWLLNVCRNMAIDKTRSKMYRNQKKSLSIDLNPGLENRLQDLPKPETIGVKRLLDHLEPSQRAVIDAVYVMGYTQAEAAEKLNIPLGTVKTRLRNAILELRKHAY